MKHFPGGKPPHPLLHLCPRTSFQPPPPYEFRSDGPALGPDSADSVTIDELESIQGYEVALDSVCRVPEAAIAALSSARRLLERQNRTETKPSIQRGNGAGRPRCEITRQQIEMFLKANFTVPSFASVLHVGKRTIERQMQEYNLSVRAQYTDITDDRLDEIILEIKKVNPNCPISTSYGWLGFRSGLPF